VGKGKDANKKKTRRSRNKRGRKNKHTADGNSASFSNHQQQQQVVIRDPDEMDGGWIDVVEDSSPAPSSKKSKLEGRRREIIDVSSPPKDNFPALLSSSSKSRGGDDNDGEEDDVCLVTTLEELSTTQLTSYAAVLGGALEEVGNAVADRGSTLDEVGNTVAADQGRKLDEIGNTVADQGQTIQDNIHEDDDDDEEMDISEEEEEEEEEVVDNSKGEEKKEHKLENNSGELRQDAIVDLTESPVVVDLTGSPTSDSVAPPPVVVPLRNTDNAVHHHPQTPKQQELERRIEKEKRILKLAELKAKARLARAKLRIAEHKKARGSNIASSASLSKDGRAAVPSSSPRPVSTLMTMPATKVRDITVGSLVIEDVALTGPPDKVRFVDTVYKLSFSGDDEGFQGEEDPVLDETAITRPADRLLSNEGNQKKSESLKLKLQLARLQLEKKKRELQERKALSSAAKQKKEGDKVNVVEQKLVTAVPYEDNHLVTQVQQQPNLKNDVDEAVVDDTPPVDRAHHAKLVELRRRQKELKQKNDIANLRNLIHRQRDLLKAQGQELTESSMQLQSCVDGIQSNHVLLNESERRLEEMHHRKRIVEGMVLRATEQLVTARKTLSEQRHRK